MPPPDNQLYPGVTSPVMQTDLGPAVYMGTPAPTSTGQALSNLYEYTGVPGLERAYSAAQRGEPLQALGEGAVNAAQLAGMMAPFAKAAGLAYSVPEQLLSQYAAAAPKFSSFGSVTGLELPEKGVEAWHGSKAAFQRFLDEYIGSGEGAQVYGMGHYVGQERRTAETYMPQGNTNEPHYMGNSIRKFGIPNASYEADQHISNYLDEGLQISLARNNTHVGWVDNALDNLESDMQFYHDEIKAAEARGDEEAEQGGTTFSAIDDAEHNRNMLRPLQEAYDWLSANRQHLSVENEPAGHMLQVDVIPDHEKFLDWDRPVKDQPKSLQDKLARAYSNLNGWGVNPDATGEEAYRGITAYMLNELKNAPPTSLSSRDMYDLAQTRASALLDTYGIPGNAYKDQFSRFAEDNIKSYSNVLGQLAQHKVRLENMGARGTSEHTQVGKELELYTKKYNEAKQLMDNPTYNYVVFNPENLDIRTIDGTPLTSVPNLPTQ